MRELSKVFQGVILGSRDRFRKGATQQYGGHVTSPDGYLLALWLHECRRVFSDKLVSYDDKNWVDKQLNELMRENFAADLIKQVSQGTIPWATIS
jgi:dynein heavy chain, axonemal